jgi:hypothetical protein
LHHKGFVKRRQVHQRSVHRYIAGECGLKFTYLRKNASLAFYTLNPVYRDKETLIGCKAVQFGGVFSMIRQFEGIISDGNPSNVGGVFSKVKVPFTCTESIGNIDQLPIAQ